MRAALPIVILLVATAPAEAGRKWLDPDTVYDVSIGDGAPTDGPADAPVTIVEWSDYACRYCNRVERTLADLSRLYPGKLRWVYRTLPLDPDDTLAAEAGLAASAQGMFWPMHDRLFALHGQVDRASVEEIASDLGLDMVRFRGDLDAGTWRKHVMLDAAAAEQLGATGTPTFFIDGRPLIGAQPLGVFQRVIDEELARADDALAQGVAPKDLYDHLVGSGHASADTEAEPDYQEPQLDPSGTYRVGLGLDGHTLGPSDALITVVEWSDFECPYCGALEPELQQLRKDYGDKIRFVYRHDPLPMHPFAEVAAEAAVAAAAQGQFWAFHDRLFADQKHLTRADLDRVAKSLGLDMKRFDADLDSHRWADAVADDAAAAGSLGIGGTPTVFINGSPIEGAVGYDELKMVVEARLDEANSLVAHGIAKDQVYGTVMSAAATGEHGDPSRMPSTLQLELQQGDRETAVEAACRDRDTQRASKFADRLKGASRVAASDECAAYGIDLR